MRAPDKIYIYREPPKNYFEDEWGESKADDMESIPYIRKDAVLEWAKNWEKIGVSDDFAYAIQTLIKHIESL